MSKQPESPAAEAPVVQEKTQPQAQSSWNFSLSQLYFWNDPTIKQYTNELNDLVIKPSAKIYDEIPQQITDFKKQYIFNISQNTRMITVCVGGVLGFLVARKVTPGLLRSIRNASFFTYGFGLFVAPEFFNPFINCPECLECKNK